MRRFWVCILCLLMVAMGCSPSESPDIPLEDKGEEPVQDLLVESETIRIGTFDYRPMEYLEDGEAAGPFIELTRMIMERLGYDYEFVHVPFGRAVEMTERGTVDMIVDLYDIPERRENILFSEQPIGMYSVHVYGNEDIEGIFNGDLLSLKGLRLGVTTGYSYGERIDALLTEENFVVESVNNPDSNFEKLRQGRLDAVIDLWNYYNLYKRQYGEELPFQILEPAMDSTYSYVGFSKAAGRYQLREDFDRELKALYEDGTYQEIMSRHDLGEYMTRFASRLDNEGVPKKYFHTPEKGPLRMGILENTPPFAYIEDDEPKGLVVDILREFSLRTSYPIDIQGYPFPRILEKLRFGELDIGADMFLLESRTEFILYPDQHPLIAMPYSLFKLKDNPFEYNGDPETLKGQRIGILLGYSLADLDYMKEDENYTIISADTPIQSVENLLKGRVDLIIDITSTGREVAQDMGVADQVVDLPIVLNTNYTYIGFSKFNELEDLVAEYERTLMTMYKDGTLQELYDRYDLNMPTLPQQ